MVTHEPEQREFADRVIWFRDGLMVKEEHISKDVRRMPYKTDTVPMFPPTLTI